MTAFRGTRAAWLPAAVTAAVVMAGAAGAARAEMGKPETCTVIKESKIQGNACKALILNGCDHPVEMNVHYEVTLRQIVILPVVAEGPAYEYREGGTEKADEKGRLAAGESRWFIHTSQPPPLSSVPRAEKVSVEVAKCKVGFDYVYQPE